MSSRIILELRWAFQSCARTQTQRPVRHCTFSTLRPLQKRKNPANSENPRSNLNIARRPDRSASQTNEEHAPKPAGQSSSSSTEVAAPSAEPNAVSSGRKVPVPVKIMPKAQITPELVLNPRERMQLEFLTRTVPRREPQKVFRERLLIYHRGLARCNFIVFVKACTMVMVAGTIFLVAPAYYTFGAPWMTVAAILFCGLSPFIATTWRTRTYVTWIYLMLPTFARQSPKAALEYARNIPDNARLQLHYMKASALPASTIVEMKDLVPISSIWRPETFQWVGPRVDKGPWYRPRPTKFFVSPKTGTGREKRDTIPGIWETVYRKIVRAENEPAAKWKP